MCDSIWSKSEISENVSGHRVVRMVTSVDHTGVEIVPTAVGLQA